VWRAVRLHSAEVSLGE
jgi:hypothetical protein